MSPELKSLAPGDKDREYLEQRLSEIRDKYQNMIFLSFPGDEKSSGGCVLYENRDKVESYLSY